MQFKALNFFLGGRTLLGGGRLRAPSPQTPQVHLGALKYTYSLRLLSQLGPDSPNCNFLVNVCIYSSSWCLIFSYPFCHPVCYVIIVRKLLNMLFVCLSISSLARYIINLASYTSKQDSYKGYLSCVSFCNNMTISFYGFNVIFKEFWHRWLCKTEIKIQTLDNDIGIYIIIGIYIMYIYIKLQKTM